MRDRLAAIMHLTMVKIREPAFVLMACMAAAIGYWVSEMEPLDTQGGQEVITLFLVAGEGVPVLTGFLVILATTLLMAVFTGATDIPRDIEGKIVMFILGKPVHRTEYLLGKYFGICAICLIFFGVATVAAVIGHVVRTGAIYPATLLARQLLLAISIFPFVAMTVMFSCFLSDLSAMIVSAIYLILAVFVSTIPLLAEMLPPNIGIDAYLYMFYYWFPNFLYFLQDFRMIGLVFPAIVVYAATVSTLFLIIAAVRINLRDMI